MSGALCVLSRIRIAKDMVFSRLHKWWLLTLLLGPTTVVSAQTSVITTVAGTGVRFNPKNNGNPEDVIVELGFSGDGGPATSAQFAVPNSLAVDASGNLFIADSQNHRIRKVDTGGTITTVAGTGGFCVPFTAACGDGGPATSATFLIPIRVAVDASGNLFIADFTGRIRKVDSGGTITTVAGDGTECFPITAACGDGGPATSAQLGTLSFPPQAVAVDASGNLFIADGTNRIRKVDSGGTITTVAGTGAQGYSGDGGPATSAVLNRPPGVAVDASGNLFIAGGNNNRIRKVDSGGTITTVAGSTIVDGFSGDGGLATSAELDFPSAVAVDASGNLFIADRSNQRVRKVSDVLVAKSDSVDPVIAGNNLTYTVTVTNSNTVSALTSVVATETLPAGVTLVSTSGCAEDPGGVPTCTLDPIPASSMGQYTITVAVDALTMGTLTNNVSVSFISGGIPDNGVAFETTVVTPAADLVITKTDSVDPVIAGNNLTYTVTATNNGSIAAQDVVVTDTLPAGVTLVSTSGCAESPAGGVPTCTLGTIAASASAQYTVTVTVDSDTTGMLTNTASAASSTTMTMTGDDSVMETTTVATSADLVSTKTDSVDPVIAGNDLTYTITVTNNGPSDAHSSRCGDGPVAISGNLTLHFRLSGRPGRSGDVHAGYYHSRQLSRVYGDGQCEPRRKTRSDERSLGHFIDSRRQSRQH